VIRTGLAVGLNVGTGDVVVVGAKMVILRLVWDWDWAGNPLTASSVFEAIVVYNVRSEAVEIRN